MDLHKVVAEIQDGVIVDLIARQVDVCCFEEVLDLEDWQDLKERFIVEVVVGHVHDVFNRLLHITSHFSDVLLRLERQRFKESWVLTFVSGVDAHDRLRPGLLLNLDLLGRD